MCDQRAAHFTSFYVGRKCSLGSNKVHSLRSFHSSEATHSDPGKAPSQLCESEFSGKGRKKKKILTEETLGVRPSVDKSQCKPCSLGFVHPHCTQQSPNICRARSCEHWLLQEPICSASFSMALGVFHSYTGKTPVIA